MSGSGVHAEGQLALQAASLRDGAAVWEMLQELGPGENGYGNDAYGTSLAGFPAFLTRAIELANGIALRANRVPYTTYWLLDSARPIGVSKLRHRLTPALLKSGGHIGFCVRPSERRKGYATALLNLTLEKARLKGIDLVLVTCDESNAGSRGVIEANGGYEVGGCAKGTCHYWIDL